MGRKTANGKELKNIIWLYIEDKNHHAFGQDGFSINSNYFYPNKSNTTDGNNPKTIFKRIAITPTA